MMGFIGDIYYIVGIFALIRLIYSFRDFSKISDLKDWSFRFKTFIGRKPVAKDYYDKKDIELLGAHTALDIFEWIWVACGLFSGNSEAFVAIIAIGLAYKYVAAVVSFGFIYKSLSIIFSILRFLLYLSMISNHFFHTGTLI
jgi:hypothetical protein